MSVATLPPKLPDAPRRQPLSPGLVHSGVAVLATLLIAVFTLTIRQSPPPAIAEFAPQAVEQIKEAPKEQSSEFGSGEGQGDCPPGSTCAAGTGPGQGGGAGGDGGGGGGVAALPPPPIDVPRVKRCVGDPPRQIEDPQSPPCVAYWDSSRGNGGATARGVTADTIRIAVPNQDTSEDQYNAYARFFNDRFQFYGRRIEFVPIEVSRESAATQRAAADKAFELQVFASTQEHDLTAYYEALAQREIIGVYRTPDYPDSYLAQVSPYLWGYTMSATQQMAQLAAWACVRLVGGKAVHAGAPLRDRPRRFGIVLDQIGQDNRLSVEPIKKALEACGAEVPYAKAIPYAQYSAVQYSNEIAQMQDAKLTTVVCLCEEGTLGLFHSSAESQRFEPEWVVTSYPQFNYTAHKIYDVPSQHARTFGVTFTPMERVPEDHPSIWALQEGSGGAGYNRTVLYVGGHDIAYRALLLLASGIQMAGPNLTAKSFREGLLRARFPNPDHPIKAGKVGFDDGDHTMTNDGVEFWWSNAAPGPYADTGPGTFCFVDGGARRKKGEWPKEDKLFDGNCDNGAKPVS